MSTRGVVPAALDRSSSVSPNDPGLAMVDPAVALLPVLVDEDGVAVGVDDDEARRSGRGLVGFARELDPGCLERLLELADVRERLALRREALWRTRTADPLLTIIERR